MFWGGGVGGYSCGLRGPVPHRAPSKFMCVLARSLAANMCYVIDTLVLAQEGHTSPGQVTLFLMASRLTTPHLSPPSTSSVMFVSLLHRAAPADHMLHALIHFSWLYSRALQLTLQLSVGFPTIQPSLPVHNAHACCRYCWHICYSTHLQLFRPPRVAVQFCCA